MSTESTDAGAAAEPSDKVRFSDLDENQRKTYQTLVQRGARYVRDSVLGLEDCSVGQLLEDSAEPHDEFTERFRADIEDELETLGPSTKDRQNDERQQTTTTTDPTEFDWRELWDRCNISQNKPLSGTQLALAIDVSDQTTVTDDGAQQFIDAAVEANQLRHFPRRKRYAPTMEGGR